MINQYCGLTFHAIIDSLHEALSLSCPSSSLRHLLACLGQLILQILPDSFSTLQLGTEAGHLTVQTASLKEENTEHLSLLHCCFWAMLYEESHIKQVFFPHHEPVFLQIFFICCILDEIANATNPL